MVDKESLRSTTTQEFYGADIAFLVNKTGRRMIRVASDINRIEEIANEKAFQFLDFKSFDEEKEPYMYVLCEDPKRESVVFLNEASGENQGVWVPEEHFDEFQRLIGLEEPFSE